MSRHALLSASGAGKWLNCPPSARLEEKIKIAEGERTSVYAEEGTLAHEIAYAYSARQYGKIDESKFNELIGKAKTNPLYDAEMEEYAKEFRMALGAFYGDGRDAALGLEMKLDFSEWVPEGFGTSDAVIFSLTSKVAIFIMDYKYGKGVKTDARNNPQLQLYALGAYSAFKDIKQIQDAATAIYQPRLNGNQVENGGFTMQIYSLEELLEIGEKRIKPTAKLAYEGAGETKAGEWCRFCRVKPICKTYGEKILKLKDRGLKAPETYTPEELAEIIPVVKELTGWGAAVEEYATAQALKGVKFPGYKLIEGRRVRRYTDEEAVIKALVKNRYEESVIAVKKPLGVSAMEKLLGKKNFSVILGELTEKPDGKPALVEETDPRPEFDSAQIDFRDYAPKVSRGKEGGENVNKEFDATD
jgi:hypothetical protein